MEKITIMYLINNQRNSRPNLNSSFISIVVAYNMHIRLRKLDYTCFLKLFDGLYNAYIHLDSFKKTGNRDLKMPYERKKVETFAIDARNRITSELQNLCCQNCK